MGLEQDIILAYTKWKNAENKAGVTKQDFKNLYSKTETLKNELCNFAKEFDKKIVNVETITGEAISEIYKKLKGQNGLYTKIANAKDFIDYKNLLGEKSYLYDDVKCFFDEIKNEPSINVDLSGHIEIITYNYEMYTRYLNLKKASEKPIIAARLLMKFFNDVFSSMHRYILKVEKIQARDEDFFDIEGDGSRKNDEGDNKVVKSDMGYISTALSYMFPHVYKWWTQSDKVEEKVGVKTEHKIEPVEGNVKIFPKRRPWPREVKQAGIGDCYLMAALVSLAKHKPQVIIDCFPQGLEKIENERYVTVRFYRGDSTKTDITIDKTKVVAPKEIKDGALWPKLIEKAYIVFKATEPYAGDRRTNISGGREKDAFMALTGVAAKRKVLENNFEAYSKKFLDLEKSIKSKLRKHQRVLCTFKKSYVVEDLNGTGSHTIMSFDKYEILDIGNIKGNDCIVLKRRDKTISVSKFDFISKYDKIIYDKFQKIEKLENKPNDSDNQEIVSKIKDQLGKNKDVICKFKKSFDIEDIVRKKTEFISSSNVYVVKEIKDKSDPSNKTGEDYVNLEYFTDTYSMSVKDFCNNCKNLQFKKLKEPGEDSAMLSKIQSAIKKGKIVICKFDSCYATDVEKGKRKSISSYHEFLVKEIKEKTNPNNKTGIDYVILQDDHDHDETPIAISIKDFCDNYKKISYRKSEKIEETSNTEKEPEIISKIRSTLKKGKAITCGFLTDFEIKDAKYGGEIIKVHSGHVYAIMGINEEKKYIRLVDPNKAWGREEKSKEGGHVAIRFEDFAKNCIEITYH